MVLTSNQHMNAFDRAMNLLDDRFHFLASEKQIVSSISEEDKVKTRWIICDHLSSLDVSYLSFSLTYMHNCSYTNF